MVQPTELAYRGSKYPACPLSIMNKHKLSCAVLMGKAIRFYWFKWVSKPQVCHQVLRSQGCKIHWHILETSWKKNQVDALRINFLKVRLRAPSESCHFLQRVSFLKLSDTVLLFDKHWYYKRISTILYTKLLFCRDQKCLTHT